VSSTRLAEEVRRLRGRRRPRDEVPADRVEFARSAGLDPDHWQRDVLASEAPRLLLNCARQSGKSTIAAIIALHKALRDKGSLILILAPSERQARETFGKLTTCYRRLGHPVPTESYRKMGLELMNGSRVEALPGRAKTVRGFSAVSLLVLDEAARVDDDLYHSVRPMLAVSGGRLMMLSTPWARRGVFHCEWVEGIGWERYRIPASQCPRIPEAFLEEERRTLGRWLFEQEYECIFGENIDAVFRHEDIRAAITDEFEPLFGSGGL
jgi:Terminase large subunit, T4likevirus-type, N-terminal